MSPESHAEGGQRLGVVLRKVKAALGIGSIWGIAFGGVGAVLGAVIPTTSFLSTALGLGVVAGSGGFVLGLGFAGLLSLMEGQRTLGELTARRAALWGFVAGAALALGGSFAIGSLMDVVRVAESLLGLPIPIGLQLAALAGGAASYGAIAAGLAAATVSLAKRSSLELEAAPSGPTRDLPSGGRP